MPRFLREARHLFFRESIRHMHLKLNGESYESRDAITVADLLKQLEIEQTRVAVELNLDILPKDKYVTTQLKDGDQLEIVHFVGGGKSGDRGKEI